MSTNAWEGGSFKLPSAAYAKFRQAIADEDLKHQAGLFEHTQTFWKGLTAKQKTNPEEYRAAFALYQRANSHTKFTYGYSEVVSDLPEDLDGVLLYQAWDRTTPVRETKPRRILKEDIPFPTNRTVMFRPDGGSASICFDKSKNTVTWESGDTARQLEEAHESDLGKAFFAQLSRVKWTRGTGGSISGNDEHHSDWTHGGGANYTNYGFGPVGADEAPYQTDTYTMADGTQVGRAQFPAVKRFEAEVAKAHARETKKQQAAITRSKATAARKAAATASGGAGVRGRAGKGVPEGGQFTGRQGRSDGPPLAPYRA